MHSRTLIVASLAISAPFTNALSVGLLNNLNNDQVKVYITAYDAVTNEPYLIPQDGIPYYPCRGFSGPDHTPIDPANIEISLGGQGSSTVVENLPDVVPAGRLYYSTSPMTWPLSRDSNGKCSLAQPDLQNPQDPNHNVQWDFSEFTRGGKDGFWVNFSYVDLIGVPYSIAIWVRATGEQSIEGLNGNSMTEVCKQLTDQARKDDRPWDSLCEYNPDGTVRRIVGAMTLAHHPKMQGYWQSHIDQVWDKYKTMPLVIDSQGPGGVAVCQVNSNEELVCKGAKETVIFAKPTTADIFTCASGPFVGGSEFRNDLKNRLCAAFNRTTLLLDGGDKQPFLHPDQYYGSSPTNHYAGIVHRVCPSGRGYAFPADDVTGNGGMDVAGVLSDPGTEKLIITIGKLHP